MSQEIDAYYTITASSEFRERERLYEKARHDEAQALYNDAKKNSIEIARKMITKGESIDKIIEYTELTLEEVKSLCDAD